MTHPDTPQPLRPATPPMWPGVASGTLIGGLGICEGHPDPLRMRSTTRIFLQPEIRWYNLANPGLKKLTCES